MPNGSRASTSLPGGAVVDARGRTCRAAPRRSAAPSRRYRCSGGSQSDAGGAGQLMRRRAARGSCRSRHWRPALAGPACSGWSPVARSMMASRVCASATLALRRDGPAPSGPRWASARGHRLEHRRRGAVRVAARARRCRTCGSGCLRLGGATSTRKSRQRAHHGGFRVKSRLIGGARPPRRGVRRARDRRAGRAMRGGERRGILDRHQQAGAGRRRSARAAPAAAAATTGRPADQASSTTLPSGSWRDGQTKMSQAASSAPMSSRQPRKATRSATPSSRASALQRAAFRALAGERQMRAGQRRQGAQRDVEALVAMQPAHGEQPACPRAAAAGARGRRAGEVGGEVRQVVHAVAPASPARRSSRRCRACCRPDGRSAR